MASDPAPSLPSGRVVFVTRKWAPAVGGMETYCLRLSEELARRTPLEVIALPGRSDGSPPGAAALLAFPFTAFARILAKRRGIAVIHLADMAIWPLAVLAGLAAGRPRIVLSAHGTDVSYHRRRTWRGRLYGVYLRLGACLLGKATVIANSRATDTVLRETGWRSICVVPLGTDMTVPPPEGTHDGAILFAGRLVERKGFGWFARHVLPVLPAGTRLEVVGPVWHSGEAAALQLSGVTHRGNLHGAELASAYRNALCVIVPNIRVDSGEYEGFGLVAPEAAASGGLVLAADCDGLKDAVLDGETGFLLPSGDAAAWADKIGEVTAWNVEERRAFLARSTRRAQVHYSWTRVADATLETYRHA